MQNYLTVLEGQPLLLGELDNDNLRKLIIDTYIQIKGLIDSFIMNNYLIEKFETHIYLFNETKSNFHRIERDKYESRLITYAAILKKSQSDTYKTGTQLIDLINKRQTKPDQG